MDFTKVLNIASNNEKKKLAEWKVKKLRADKMKGEGSSVKTDAVRSFLQKKEIEKRKKECEEMKRKAELLNLRAAAKHNRKATAMAKRTKDNNFVLNAQPRDESLKAPERNENKSNLSFRRLTCSESNNKMRPPMSVACTENKILRQGHKINQSEKMKPTLKNPTRSENVKNAHSARPQKLVSGRKALDFNSLLKLAEKKQFEPIKIEAKPKPKLESEPRLMTQAERDRFNEERTRKFNVNSGTKTLNVLKSDNKASTVEKNSNKTLNVLKTNSKLSTVVKNTGTTKPATVLKKHNVKTEINKKKIEITKKPLLTNKPKPEMIKTKTEIIKSKPNINEKLKRQIPADRPKSFSANSLKRPLPPSCAKSSSLPPAKIPRALPNERRDLVRPLQTPTEKRRLPPLPPIGHVLGRQRSHFPSGPIRRRVESDDEDYDPEMDDFIDDGPVGNGDEDYSKHIREIFGYDKRRYMFMDDDETDCMESSFTRQMQEEAYSARVGLLEDLEDIRKEQEELEKKYKCKKKK